MGLIDDGAQLLVGVLLGTGRPGVGHHPARGADLDELGAVLDLVAHRLADLVDTVGDALLDRPQGALLAAGVDRVDLLLAALGPRGGQLARQEVVPGVAVLDLDDLAGGAEATQFTTTPVFTRAHPSGPLVWSGQVPTRLATIFGQTGSDLHSLVDEWNAASVGAP